MDIDTRPGILIGGANAEQARALAAQLTAHYDIRIVDDGPAALALAHAAPRPDLLILDARLPVMDGFAACQELRSNFLTMEIPVLLVVDAADVGRAYEAGASDVVTHPVDPRALNARAQANAQLRRNQMLLKGSGGALGYLVAERTRELVQMQDATVIAMATLAEAQEANVLNHLCRTQRYVVALARELRFHPRFSGELTEENIGLLFKAAPLHDIGKVGVPDAILLKPGKLTDQEFEVMKQHTTIGRDAIAGVEQMLGFSTPFLRYAREITWSHQERWDGSGYPQGLKGASIPVSSRLMAVADVYDALISRRLYRPAFTHETAIELIRQGRDEHFDPDVVDAMLAIEEKILAIAYEFHDAP